MASSKIKDFFNGRFFEIPKYQRGYAWEIQNISMTKKLASEIDTKKGFTKTDLQKRTKILADFCLDRWWSE